RPASLPETVRLLSVRVRVNALLMKCGLPAHTTGTVQAAITPTTRANMTIRVCFRYILVPPSIGFSGDGDIDRITFLEQFFASWAVPTPRGTRTLHLRQQARGESTPEPNTA